MLLGPPLCARSHMPATHQIKSGDLFAVPLGALGLLSPGLGCSPRCVVLCFAIGGFFAQRHLRGECMRDHEPVLGLAELIRAGPEAAEAQGVDRSTYERGRTASAWPRRRLTTPAVNRSRSRPASPPLAVWAGVKRCAPWPHAKVSSTRTLTAPAPATPPTRKRGAEGKSAGPVIGSSLTPEITLTHREP